MHHKLVAALSAIPPPQSEDEALRTAIARGLMTGYHHRWIDEDWMVESVEQEFHIPIYNPASGRRSPLFTHAGKFDGIVSRNADPYLLEHKTCREDIGPGSPYWSRLAIDTQISGYLLASWLLGQKLKGVLYDVIRKPEIRPKLLGLKDSFTVRTTGIYCNLRLSPEAFQQFSLAKDLRETPEMFEARLIQDTLDRPDWYFGRQIVSRLNHELLTYAEELWRTAKDVRLAQSTNDHRRNDKACFAFHRPCEYLGLCAGHDDTSRPYWRQLPTLHPELEDPTCGPSTLTHSRLGTFATCRRKHFYRYGLGISRWDTPEPLAFGSLLHEALASWWAAGSTSESEAFQANGGVKPGQAPTQPHPPARRAGMGQDEPGGHGAVSRLSHDQE